MTYRKCLSVLMVTSALGTACGSTATSQPDSQVSWVDGRADIQQPDSHASEDSTQTDAHQVYQDAYVDNRPPCPPVNHGAPKGFTSSSIPGVITGGGTAVIPADQMDNTGGDVTATGLKVAGRCDLSRAPIIDFSWSPAVKAGTEQRLIVTAYYQGIETGTYTVGPALSPSAGSLTGVQTMDYAALSLRWIVATKQTTGRWELSKIEMSPIHVCPQDWCI